MQVKLLALLLLMAGITVLPACLPTAAPPQGDTEQDEEIEQQEQNEVEEGEEGEEEGEEEDD